MPRTAALFPHTDPATDEVIAAVPDMDAAAAAAAVDGASAALAAWRATLAKDRAAILERMHELMHAHSEDLAHVMTLECGKPLAESRGEVAYGASFYKWFAEEARRINGQVLQTHAADKRLVTLKQPVGVASMYEKEGDRERGRQRETETETERQSHQCLVPLSLVFGPIVSSAWFQACLQYPGPNVFLRHPPHSPRFALPRPTSPPPCFLLPEILLLLLAPLRTPTSLASLA